MAELKTKKNSNSVEDFLETIEDESRRQDSYAVLQLMREVTGAEPGMWGDSIVGFGAYHYRYQSGREGEWFLVGFSPRKHSLTLYIMSGFDEYDQLLARLGKHKIGKACLYVNKLADVDQDVLRRLVTASVRHMQASHSP
ncbi:MAG: DUF1801 domain-containing protein [Anaerolineae bacterium]|jgi:hypothetical protein|nr:DUF1801 domain-containing protein [Anaerolineae bacterium]